MKTTHKLMIALVVLVLALPVVSQNWSPAPGSWLKVTGTSTMHDWEVQTDKIDGSVSFPADFFEAGQGPVKASVLIKAGSLKSDSARMDRVMYKALNVEKYPDIKYQLKSAKPISANEAVTTGDLTVAGKTLPIEMNVTMSRPDANTLVLTGSVPLNMRNYGIDPPTAMLGAIRTGEQVKVSFQWKLAVR